MLEQTLYGLVENPLKAMGYRLVRVKIMGNRHSPTVQFMAERLDETAMGIDDCTHISRYLSGVLDNQDVLQTAYRLEVSSPGIDRPLMNYADFAKYEGFVCLIYLKESSEKGKRIEGVIHQVLGGGNGGSSSEPRDNSLMMDGGWRVIIDPVQGKGNGLSHGKNKTNKGNEKEENKNYITIMGDNIESAKLVITDELLKKHKLS